MFWTEISLGLLGGFGRVISNPNLFCLNIAGRNLNFFKTLSKNKIKERIEFAG